MTTSPAIRAQGNTGCSQLSTAVLRVSRACLYTTNSDFTSRAHEQGGYKWTLTKFGFWCFACGYSDLKQLQPLVPGVLNKVIDIEFGLHCRTNRCSVKSAPFAAVCVVSCMPWVQGPHALGMQLVTAKARLEWVPVPPA